MKVDIFQPIVPEYRVALFNGVGKALGDDVAIQAAERIGGDLSYPLESMAFDYGHPFKKIGPFVWQRALRFNKAKGKGDVAVICGDIHQLSSLWVAFKAKLKGIKVVWWGHHVSANAKPFAVKFRLMVARWLSDVYLCYTSAGVEFLKKRGFKRVFATGNTLDLEAIEAARQKYATTKVCNGKTLIFCGVLREKVRLDVLIKALKLLRERDKEYRLIVIGAGDKFEEWKKLADSLGISDAITWTGELRGAEALVPWFAQSQLFVYPGAVGLSIVHGLAFGLPLILHDNPANQMPEYTLFKPNENGFSAKEGDAQDFARVIDCAFSDNQFRKLGENGRQLVHREYSMEKMVANFIAAING